MNPLAILLGVAVRALPWAVIGGAGALVGSIAVHGARSAAVVPPIPGQPGDDEDGASGPGRVVVVRPAELTAGTIGGPLLAVVLRPRPLGAFLGGLAAGAAAAALVPDDDRPGGTSREPAPRRDR